MDTTRRDVIPPNFDSPSWANLPTPAPRHHHAAAGAGTAAPVPPDSPTVATTSSPLPANLEATAATQMTYASKLPPDHPGLRLERPKPRTLRTGPLLATVAVLGVFVAVAVIVALTPRTDHAKGSSSIPSESPTKDIALPDAVRDAPDSNADLANVPRLGQPLQRGAPERASARFRNANAPDGIGKRYAKSAPKPSCPRFSSSSKARPGADGAPGALPNRLLGRLPAVRSAPPRRRCGGGGSADPNMQQHKADFLSREGANNATYVSEPLTTPRSPYEVKAGHIIPTTLITGINSDLPGQSSARSRERVRHGLRHFLLIPQGSRLLATYDSSVSFGQERVLVCWNRLIRPDGVSIGLECMPGVDLAGYAGFADEVNNHWLRIITGVALGTLISATAQRSQGDVSGFNRRWRRYGPTTPAAQSTGRPAHHPEEPRDPTNDQGPPRLQRERPRWQGHRARPLQPRGGAMSRWGGAGSRRPSNFHQHERAPPRRRAHARHAHATPSALQSTTPKPPTGEPT